MLDEVLKLRIKHSDKNVIELDAKVPDSEQNSSELEEIRKQLVTEVFES